jgi:large repetitive protein
MMPIGKRLARAIQVLLAAAAAGTLVTSLPAPAHALSAPCDASSTSASASPNPLVSGQTLTFTAQVTSVGTTANVGSVEFYIDQKQVGSAAVGATSGATFTTTLGPGGTPLSAGPHAWYAEYTGGGFDPFICASQTSPASFEVTRQADSTSTSLVSSSAGHSSFGQTVTFRAHVSGVPASPAGGSMTFLVDGVPAVTTAVDGSGNAAYTTSTLAAGVHTVVADYSAFTTSADAFAASQSAPVVETVTPTQHVTATVVTLTPNTILFGQALTAAVHVAAGASAVPGGSVTVYIDDTPTATIALDGAGSASFHTSTLAPGAHQIYAQYGGDAGSDDVYASSASPAAAVTVNSRATQTALTAATDPSTTTELVTFSVTVSDAVSGGAISAGTTTLTIDGKAVATKPVNPQGRTNFTVGPLNRGTHVITASFSGNATELPSASPATSQRVTLPPVVNPAVMGATAFYTFRPLSTGATEATLFEVTGLPAGAQLRLACSGARCPIKMLSASIARRPACHAKHCRSGVTKGRGRVNLLPRLAGKRFAPGTHLQLDITKPGWVGKRYVFTMRARRNPGVRITYPAAAG